MDLKRIETQGVTQTQAMSLAPNRRALIWIMGRVNEFLYLNKEGILGNAFSTIIDDSKSSKVKSSISITSTPYIAKFYFITEKNVHKFKVELSRRRKNELLPLTDGDINLLKSLSQEIPLAKALEFELFTLDNYEGFKSEFTSIVKLKNGSGL